MCLLACYSLTGKAVAYVSIIRPLYIGDVLLICGIGVTLLYNKGLFNIFRIFPSKLLLIFMLWGALCTFHYISTYGVNSLRDAAIWGYGLYAFVISGLLVNKVEYLPQIIKYYKWFIPRFLLLLPVCVIINARQIPFVIVLLRQGEIGVQLSGVLSFIMSGLIKKNLLWLYIAFLEAITILTYNRGAVLTVLSVITLFIFMRPFKNKLWRRLISVISILFLIIILLSPIYNIFPERRLSRMKSIFITGEASDEGTKSWRISWWQKIIDDTVYGDYFWMGQGYGINLADKYGYQVDNKHSLRSPHNGHLTILARSGVTGFILWIYLQLTWVWNIVKYYKLCRKNGQTVWENLFLFLLAFWLAFMVNTNFDVFLEGPQGGIWFWTVFGIGLGAMYIYKTSLQIL